LNTFQLNEVGTPAFQDVMLCHQSCSPSDVASHSRSSQSAVTAVRAYVSQY